MRRRYEEGPSTGQGERWAGMTESRASAHDDVRSLREPDGRYEAVQPDRPAVPYPTAYAQPAANANRTQVSEETRDPYEAMHDRQRERFGGMKVGSAFFGWLAAMGTAVLLVAIVSAAGAAVGLATGTNVGDVVGQATSKPETVGVVGGIALAIILFAAYYCGGYVAGRMARFDGARQGLAVWLWALLAAVIVAMVGVIAGDKYDVFARLNGFPRIPVNEGDLTVGGVVAAIVAAAVALIGAILGGGAGMRFHRRVDRAADLDSIR